MTDARLAPVDLLRAAASMPPRSAIIVRRDALSHGRVATIRALRRIARARRHLLLTSGRALAGFDGRHASGGVVQTAHGRRPTGWLSMPVHSGKEAMRARTLHADAVLVSPFYPTRSHPHASGIGGGGFRKLCSQSGRPAIALGGMTAARFRAARRFGAMGWAAIDAWVMPGPT